MTFGIQESLRIEPFRGSPDELAQLINSVWLDTYRGKMIVPLIDADFLKWQLRTDQPEGRRRMLAAYDGDRAVGAILHFPVTFELGKRIYKAAQSSWLTVSTAYRGKGVARKLHEANQQAMRDEGMHFRAGYGYVGSKVSLGMRFWRKTEGTSSTFAGKVGFWVQVLDPARAVAWSVKTLDRFLIKAGAPLIPRIKKIERPGLVVRDVRQADVARCVELSDAATRHCDLRVVWDQKTLAHQLGQNGFAQGLVAEENGIVNGCMSFHLLRTQGKTTESIGVIDALFTDGLSSAGRTAMLNEALARLQDQGAVVALKLRGGDYPSRTFFRPGWFWNPADSHLILTWADQPQPIPRLKNFHLLWR